jgi:outer membrane biosynthesis protein TonB
LVILLLCRHAGHHRLSGEGGTTNIASHGCVIPAEEILMDSYTITIAPNDDSGAATRLVVDTSGEQVQITHVHLHAPQGLSTGHIPTVDFDLLLQAVSGTVTASPGHTVTAATELSAPQHPTPALEAATATEPTEPPAAPTGRDRKTTPRATPTPAPRPARTRTVKQPATKAVGKAAPQTPPLAPVAKRVATRAAAPAKSQPSARRTRAATTAASTGSGRVYRRTPGDLTVVFERVGTVAGVAAHYEVPGYTAQGWVSRLRATA